MRTSPGLAALQRFLQTPRGVLALLGAALAFSAAVAVALALNRDFFERHVRERYPPPSRRLAELGRGLDGERGLRQVRRLSAGERRLLYTTWMQVGDSWPPAAARTLVTADPETFLDAAFKTLIAGSLEQRRRAVSFLVQSRHPAARELLEEALARAEARHETGLAAALREAINALTERRP